MWVELELRVGGDGLAFAEMKLHGGLDGALYGRGRRWCGLWGSRWCGVWVVMALRRGVRSSWRGLWTEIELCVGGYDSPWPN